MNMSKHGERSRNMIILDQRQKRESIENKELYCRCVKIILNKKHKIIMTSKSFFKYTNNIGFDGALEVIVLPKSMRQGVRSIGLFGLTTLVGTRDKWYEIFSYQGLLEKEIETMKQ